MRQLRRGLFSMDKAEWKHALTEAAKARDRRLRRQLLTALFECRASPSGWTGAVTLRDLAEAVFSDDQRFENEQHCIALLRDLLVKGLVEERQKTRRRDETFSLKHLEYRILGPGLNLHLEAAPPDPMIDDDRVPVGE